MALPAPTPRAAAKRAAHCYAPRTLCLCLCPSTHAASIVSSAAQPSTCRPPPALPPPPQGHHSLMPAAPQQQQHRSLPQLITAAPRILHPPRHVRYLLRRDATQSLFTFFAVLMLHAARCMSHVSWALHVTCQLGVACHMSVGRCMSHVSWAQSRASCSEEHAACDATCVTVHHSAAAAAVHLHRAAVGAS